MVTKKSAPRLARALEFGLCRSILTLNAVHVNENIIPDGATVGSFPLGSGWSLICDPVASDVRSEQLLRLS